jgi:hypothetical protein
LRYLLSCEAATDAAHELETIPMAKISTAAANKHLAFARKLIERAATIGDVDLIVDTYLDLVAGSNDRKRQLRDAGEARRVALAGTDETAARVYGTFRRAGSSWSLVIDGEHEPIAAGRAVRTRKADGSVDIAFVGVRASSGAYDVL